MAEPQQIDRRRRIDNLFAHDQPMISVGDFARYCGVRTRQVWKWHDAGLLAIHTLPERCHRIERTEAIRFLAAHRSLRTPA